MSGEIPDKIQKVQNEDEKKIKIKDMTPQQRREYERKMKQNRRELEGKEENRRSKYKKLTIR